MRIGDSQAVELALKKGCLMETVTRFIAWKMFYVYLRLSAENEVMNDILVESKLLVQQFELERYKGKHSKCQHPHLNIKRRLEYRILSLLKSDKESLRTFVEKTQR